MAFSNVCGLGVLGVQPGLHKLPLLFFPPHQQISENEVITKAAYILFYRARDDSDVSTTACAAPDLSRPAGAKTADSGVHYAAGTTDNTMLDISEDEVAKALAEMDELD
jgi:hypothetical protein